MKKTAKKKNSKAIVKKQSAEPIPKDMNDIISKIVLQGDLRALTPEQKVSYYNNICRQLGLNSMTRPFDYIILNNREVLYANKSCTDQLRKIHGISVEKIDHTVFDGIYISTVLVRDKTGRTDGATGAVNISGLKGLELANAIMKAETKSKRRATLSVAGLGIMDESEIDGAFSNGTSITLALDDKTQPEPKEAESGASVVQSGKRPKGDFAAALGAISSADKMKITVISARLHEREWTPEEETELREKIGIRMAELMEAGK
jgi:hypothetical protein